MEPGSCYPAHLCKKTISALRVCGFWRPAGSMGCVGSMRCNLAPWAAEGACAAPLQLPHGPLRERVLHSYSFEVLADMLGAIIQGVSLSDHPFPAPSEIFWNCRAWIDGDIDVLHMVHATVATAFPHELVLTL
eukprot:1160478-Pelagomonas_calceolata.AAC.3